MDRERLIICNTSPLINLAEIDLLNILDALPGQACMPPGLRDEVMAKSGLFARAALASGLPFTGTLGLLASAKARGQIAALAPALHDLRTHARFWINSHLERDFLEEAGESK